MYKLAICKRYGHSLVRQFILFIKRLFSNRYVTIHKNIDLRQHDQTEEED